MAQRGRPSDYSAELADEICERIATGESLKRMCCEEEHLPDERTVYRWLLKHEDFRQKYTHAREFQTEPYFEEIREISDNSELDPNDKRVRIDTRKWMMGKMKPKRYGEKVQQEHSGELTVSHLSDDALAARIAAKMDKAKDDD